MKVKHIEGRAVPETVRAVDLELGAVFTVVEEIASAVPGELGVRAYGGIVLLRTKPDVIVDARGGAWWRELMVQELPEGDQIILESTR